MNKYFNLKTFLCLPGIFTFLILLLPGISSGQKLIKFSGNVQDDTGTALGFASVIACLEDSVIIAYCIANNKGEYTLSFHTSAQRINLKASLIGYKEVTFNSNDATFGNKEHHYNFILFPKQILLKEVLVKAPAKVLAPVDTLTFSAAAYRDNSEKVVEDLLKKIPGINVAKDGSISIKGKIVDRLLIEGDDLFKKEYTLLSKNLSADLIDKVQVINNYSDNALLKGITHTDGKAINLTLKKDPKKILFGNLSAGIGTSQKQDFSTNVISFLKKVRIYCLGNSNTIGRNPSPSSYEENQQYNESKSLTDNIRNISLAKADRSYNGNIDEQMINTNSVKLLSASFIIKPIPSLAIRSSGWLLSDHSSLTQNNSYHYYIPGNSLLIEENNYYKTTPRIISSNIDINYKINPSSEIKIASNLKYAASKTTAIIKSDNFYYNNLKDNNLRISEAVDFTHRIADNKAFTLNAAYLQDKGQQYFFINRLPPGLIPFNNTLSDSLYQFTQYPLEAGKVSGDYFVTKKSWRLHITLDGLLRKQSIQSMLDTAGFNNSLDHSGNFSNHDGIRQSTSSLTFKMLKQINKFQLTASLSANYLNTFFLSARQPQTPIDTTVLYITPVVGIKWAKQGHAAALGYSHYLKFPEIEDMYGNYIFKDYRTLEKGENSFKPSLLQTCFFDYSYSNLSSQFMSYFHASYTKIKHVMGQEFTATKEYDIINKISTNDNQTATLYLAGVDKLIPVLSTNIKFKTSIFFNKFINKLNSREESQINSFTSTTQLSFRSAFKGLFNYNTGSILHYSKSKINDNDKTMVFENSYVTNFLDLQFRFSENLLATFNSEHYYFHQIDSGKKSYYFINMSTQYELIRNKLSFSVTGRNLTNHKNYKNARLINYTRQVQTYPLIPLYILMEIKFRF